MKEYSYIRRALLRELSEDARTSVTTLARRLKCSRNTVISNMKSLEKDFETYYTLELNRSHLGINTNQVLTIKFEKKPTTQELHEIFKDDSFVRLVAQTEGDFDLVINMVSESEEKSLYWGLSTAISMLPYRPIIKPTQIALSHTGFIPILTKSLERMDITRAGLDVLDKKIILLLNENSRQTYKAIAKKLGENVETVRYRMRKISKTGIITRFTLVMRRPPTDYNTCFMINYKLAPGVVQKYKDGYNYYLGLDEKLPIINTLQYMALASGSYMLFGMGCFENKEKAMEGVLRVHQNIHKEDSPEIAFARITNVIKGDIPARNIDLASDFDPLKIK